MKAVQPEGSEDTKSAEAQKVDDILQKREYLEKVREPWKNRWEEITKFVLPRRSLFDFSRDHRASKVTSSIYDGTPLSSLILLTDGLQGYMTSPATDWFHFTMSIDRINDLPGVRKWLQEVEKRIYYLLQQSNFYEVIGEVFLDGGSIGTATMYVEENEHHNGIRFLSRHPKSIYIAENRQKRVDTVFDRYYMTRKDLIKYYGKAKFDQTFLDRTKDNPYEELKVTRAIFPREERDYYKIDNLNMPIASITVLEDERILLSESGFNSMPYIVWRWRTNSDEWYGRSPADDAISDILRSNQIAKATMEAAEKAARPPYMYPADQADYFRDLNLIPNMGIPKGNNGDTVEYLTNTGSYPISKDISEEIQTAIRTHFRTDFFLMISNMQQKNMTATQVIEMQGEKAATLGPIVSRISSELLDPMFDRVFDIAMNAGWLPPLPMALQQLPGAEMKVDYVGTLAQAQKRYHQTQGINQALQQTIPLLEYFPESKDYIDGDVLFKKLFHANSMPEDIIRDDKAVDGIRNNRAKQQQALQQTAQLGEMADIVNKTKEAPEPGSPAEALVAGMQKGAGGQKSA